MAGKPLTLAINDTFSGDRNILRIGRIEKAFVDVTRIDEAARFDVGCVVSQIGASQNRRRTRDVQVHVALEKQRSRQVFPRGNQHGAAPTRAALVDRGLDGCGVEVFSVADCPKQADVEQRVTGKRSPLPRRGDLVGILRWSASTVGQIISEATVNTPDSPRRYMIVSLLKRAATSD